MPQVPITFVNNVARSSSGGATTTSPTLPGSRVTGNILIAFAGFKAAGTPTLTTGPGWVVIDTQTVGTWSAIVAWRRIDGTEAAPTFTSPGGSVANFSQALQMTGPDPNMVSPIGAKSANTGSTSTHSVNALTTTRNASGVIYLDAAAANTALTSPGGVWTQDIDQGSATGATRDSMGHSYVATSGSSSGNISTTGANAAWVMWQIELLSSGPVDTIQETRPFTGALMPGGGVVPNITPGLKSERGRVGPGRSALNRFVDYRNLDPTGAAIPAAATGTLKTAFGLADASIKTFAGLAKASTKTFGGLTP